MCTEYVYRICVQNVYRICVQICVQNVYRICVQNIFQCTDTKHVKFISKSLIKHLNNLQGKRDINKLHKTAILGAAHILRKVQNEQNIEHGK